MSQEGPSVPVVGLKLRGGAEGRYHLLRGAGTLAIGESQATLRIVYDPPASGWIALLLTVATFALVHISVAARWVTMAAGPGFVPWYLVVRALRQRRVELPLGADNITEAVVDPGGGLLAVRVSGTLGDLHLADGWLGLQLGAPAQALPAIQKLWGSKLRQGRVERGMSNLLLIICLSALFLLVVATLGAVAASGVKRYRDKAQQVETRSKLMQVRQAASQWTAEKTGCPSLSDLTALLPPGFSPNDRWGNPVRITCDGPQISVRSAGHDGTFDTPDDIAAP